MKKIIFILFVFMSASAVSETQKFCDEIQRFRIWAGGSDKYGIWVEYKTNPQACPGGFYLKHGTSNKSYVLSFLLAEKAQNNRVCIQTVTSDMIGNRCRLNYAYIP